MQDITVEDVQFEVGPHKSGKDVSTLTLHATINGKPCKQSIAVYSKFIFDCDDSSYRESLLNDVITKLSYDLIMKSYTGFDDKIKDKCNLKDILNEMSTLYNK